MEMANARTYCKKNFGDLVVITGESERKFLWKQARNLVTDVSPALHYPSYLRPTVAVDKGLNDNNKVSFCDGILLRQ